MPAERTDRPSGPSRNMIARFPTGVSCRYVAETFGDKLREQKLREKQMFFSLLDAEFFKIKRKHREVNVDIETSFYQGVCEICNSDARVRNYYMVLFYQIYNILPTIDIFSRKKKKIILLIFLKLSSYLYWNGQNSSFSSTPGCYSLIVNAL